MDPRLGHATEFSSLAGTSGRSRAMKWPAFGTWVYSAVGSCRLLACRSEGRDQSLSPDEVDRCADLGVADASRDKAGQVAIYAAGDGRVAGMVPDVEQFVQ